MRRRALPSRSRFLRKARVAARPLFNYPGSVPLGCVPPAHMEHAAMEEVHGVVSVPQCLGRCRCCDSSWSAFHVVLQPRQVERQGCVAVLIFPSPLFFLSLHWQHHGFPDLSCLTATVSAARRVTNNTRWICSLFFHDPPGTPRSLGARLCRDSGLACRGSDR